MKKNQGGMISINLTPYEELDNKFWFVPDIICALIMVVGVHLYAVQMIATQKVKIQKLEEDRAEIERSMENIEEKSKEIETLKDTIREIDKKISDVASVTLSPISRHEGVILVELMQVLKPVGVWYTSMEFRTSNKEIRISGFVHDPLMVAEFVRILRSTRDKTPPEGSEDLRAQVYFERVKLEKFERSSFSLPGDFPPLKGVHRFDLNMNYKTRSLS